MTKRDAESFKTSYTFYPSVVIENLESYYCYKTIEKDNNFSMVSSPVSNFNNKEAFVSVIFRKPIDDHFKINYKISKEIPVTDDPKMSTHLKTIKQKQYRIKTG